MIIERGDFFVIHEPFCTLYDTGEFLDFSSYGEVMRWIQELSKDQLIFIKETCEYNYSEVFSDDAFLSCAQHAFMIRDLSEMVASHYKMNPKVTPVEIGYENLFKLKRNLQRLGKTFFQIDSQELVNEPEETILKFCEHMSIPFVSAALSWEVAQPGIWKRTQRWHTDAENSTCFSKTNNVYQETIHNSAHLMELYNYNLPFYRQFL